MAYKYVPKPKVAVTEHPGDESIKTTSDWVQKAPDSTDLFKPKIVEMLFSGKSYSGCDVGVDAPRFEVNVKHGQKIFVSLQKKEQLLKDYPTQWKLL